MVAPDPNRAAEEMAQWAEKLQRSAERYQDLQGRMESLSVTRSSADGRVTVTVDANGVTTDIRLAPAARGMDPAALAAELMSCTRRAQAELRTRVTDLVHDVVGVDAAGESIIGQYAARFPDPEPEQPSYTPPSAPAPPSYPTPSAAPGIGAAGRTPDRDRVVTPDEPDEDDLYFRRRSWLQ